MFRSWIWWMTLFLLAISLGYFWLLGRGVIFQRVDPAARPAAEVQR